MLRRRCFLAALAATGACFPSGAQRKEQRKPDLEVLRISSLRQEGKITYEGALKVTGEKPLQGLVLQFHFFESRGVLLSMQKIQIEEQALMPGDERKFHVQGHDVPRAVNFRLAATDGGNRDLSLGGAGPHPLD